MLEGASVQTVYLPYSDATLFGLLIQGSNSFVKEAGRAAVSALKAAAQGIKEEDLKSAVSKAKFTAANATDSREGIVTVLSSKVLVSFYSTFVRYSFCSQFLDLHRRRNLFGQYFSIAGQN